MGTGPKGGIARGAPRCPPKKGGLLPGGPRGPPEGENGPASGTTPKPQGKARRENRGSPGEQVGNPKTRRERGRGANPGERKPRGPPLAGGRGAGRKRGSLFVKKGRGGKTGLAQKFGFLGILGQGESKKGGHGGFPFPRGRAREGGMGGTGQGGVLGVGAPPRGGGPRPVRAGEKGKGGKGGGEKKPKENLGFHRFYSVENTKGSNRFKKGAKVNFNERGKKKKTSFGK